MKAASFFHPAKKISFFATAGKADAAIITFTARGGKRAEYPVAFFEFAYSRSRFFYNTGEFVAHHSPHVKPRLPAMIDMQIGAADTRHCYSYNGIGCRCQYRICNRTVFNYFFSAECQGLHAVKIRW